MTEENSEIISDPVEVQDTPQVEQVEQHIEEDNQSQSDEAQVEIDVDYSKNVKRRIDKLSKKLSAKDQEIEHWRKLAEQNAAPKAEQQRTAPQRSGNGKPDVNDFDTIIEFTEALTDWKIDQERLKIIEAQRFDGYNKKAEVFKQSAPDFDEALSELGVLSGDIAEFVVESDIGPAVLYHLANDLDEFDRINRLSKTRRIIALNAIEQAITTKKKSKPAPAPIVRPSGNPTPISTSEQKQTWEEYKRWRLSTKLQNSRK